MGMLAMYHVRLNDRAIAAYCRTTQIDSTDRTHIFLGVPRATSQPCTVIKSISELKRQYHCGKVLLYTYQRVETTTRYRTVLNSIFRQDRPVVILLYHGALLLQWVFFIDYGELVQESPYFHHMFYSLRCLQHRFVRLHHKQLLPWKY